MYLGNYILKLKTFDTSIILCISVLVQTFTYAQDYQFFSILPDIGAAKNQSQFKSITADSQFLYIIGDQVTSLDSMGNNKDIDIYISKFDYYSNFEGLELLQDSSMINPYISNNNPFYKLNDSIYFYILFSINNSGSQYAITNIAKLNIRSKKLIKVIDLPLPIKDLGGISTFVQSEIKEDTIYLIFKNYTTSIIDTNYLYKISADLSNISLIKLTEFQNKYTVYRWVNKIRENVFELIGESYEILNNQLSAKGNLFYMKVDGDGKILLRKDLNNIGNYYIGTGQTYTIHHNEDKSFTIALNEWLEDDRIYSIRPHIMKLSSEFDSVFWLTNFSEYSGFNLEPDYYLMYMCSMKDGSGYVASCSSDYSKSGVADYGILFKASQDGDSLWLRKYQPIGWDSSRAKWMRFNQVICTPYNTLAVVARVADRDDGVIKGWLLHLDSEGCLIPGCGKIVRVEDIRSGKEKAFEIYPNPTSSDHIYLQSRISSSQDIHIGIYNLQGKELKITKFRPQEGVQYILDLPQEIPNGEYILQIRGREFNQSEKLVISK